MSAQVHQISWKVGDRVRNPRNGYVWTIYAIQNGHAGLQDTDGNGMVHVRPLAELSARFEKE